MKMKHYAKRKTPIAYLALYVLFILLAGIPAIGMASSDPVFTLGGKTNTIKPGEGSVIDVQIQNMPPVYGVELSLRFDPDVIEIVDTDPDREGHQIKPDTFFALNESHFTLQNKADNSEGRIDYTMCMLNPAPSAQGDGILLRIPFRAKAEGDGGLQVEKMKFGTRDGLVIVPKADSVQRINVSASEWNLMPALLPLILIFLLAVGWLFKFRRAANALSFDANH